MVYGARQMKRGKLKPNKRFYKENQPGTGKRIYPDHRSERASFNRQLTHKDSVKRQIPDRQKWQRNQNRSSKSFCLLNVVGGK